MIASTVLSGIQTGLSIYGMLANAKKNKEALDLNNIGKVGAPTKYNVGGGLINSISKLGAESERGYSNATKAGVESELENTRRAEVNLAKETSGGSGGNAFYRSMAAGLNKSESYSKFMRGDEDVRMQKLNAYMNAMSDLEGKKFAAHSTYENQKMDQQKTNVGIDMQKYQFATGEQQAWGESVGSGISNLTGGLDFSKYLKKIQGIKPAQTNVPQ